MNRSSFLSGATMAGLALPTMAGAAGLVLTPRQMVTRGVSGPSPLHAIRTTEIASGDLAALMRKVGCGSFTEVGGRHVVAPVSRIGPNIITQKCTDPLSCPGGDPSTEYYSTQYFTGVLYVQGSPQPNSSWANQQHVSYWSDPFASFWDTSTYWASQPRSGTGPKYDPAYTPPNPNCLTSGSYNMASAATALLAYIIANRGTVTAIVSEFADSFANGAILAPLAFLTFVSTWTTAVVFLGLLTVIGVSLGAYYGWKACYGK